jgi:hypothetical protein
MACSKFGVAGNPEWDAVKDAIMANKEKKTVEIIAVKIGREERDVERILNEINRLNPRAIETLKTYFGLCWEAS